MKVRRTMNETRIHSLFNSMKKVFDCENLILMTYTDPCSVVSMVLSQNKDEFIGREIERRKVASICMNVVRVNLSVIQKVSNEYVEEILLHEITHYLLLPKDTSNHPQFFWDELNNNCKIWKKKRGAFK